MTTCDTRVTFHVCVVFAVVPGLKPTSYEEVQQTPVTKVKINDREIDVIRWTLLPVNDFRRERNLWYYNDAFAVSRVHADPQPQTTALPRPHRWTAGGWLLTTHCRDLSITSLSKKSLRANKRLKKKRKHLFTKREWFYLLTLKINGIDLRLMFVFSVVDEMILFQCHAAQSSTTKTLFFGFFFYQVDTFKKTNLHFLEHICILGNPRWEKNWPSLYHLCDFVSFL